MYVQETIMRHDIECYLILNLARKIPASGASFERSVRVFLLFIKY